eukprot:2863200-Alexandrium_andersonii.AAC.1
MSASLVGSEMCIRDSPIEVRATRTRTKRSGEHATACKLECSRAHSNEPVSYTHLTLPTICSV